MRLFRAGFLVAAAVTVYGAVTGREKAQWIAKPLLMPLLAADVATEGAEMPSTDRTVLIGSLGAATVGDILLIDPDDDRRLIAGASSFAVMQAGYSALWWRMGGRPTAGAVVPRVVAWLGAAGLLRAKAPSVAAPLTAYGVALGTATVLASDPVLEPAAKNIAGVNVPGADPRSRLGLGALLFTVSDGLIVLRRLFARGERARRVTEAAILATYAAAQYLLADPKAHVEPAITAPE
ncbi:lysoplasmalogenase [Nocardia sp. NBC_00508]|uniref:lysoplasmalogenase family protein n=1 Tax=Nocardia sp. NBC_00508 TaxID=2975992 RepID=UPI002E811D4E|nr:lysoplasmalogenase family protein [Nocardia sp. NBC_00508]WUD69147.1 lysoplasmalogenase [Nocardia sp. NBC_00508]